MEDGEGGLWYGWRVLKKKRKRGGWETERAGDWLPLPAPSHLTANLSSSQSGASAPFKRCQGKKLKDGRGRGREEESEMMDVLLVAMCSGCTL